jgi:hypothetical protein
MTNWGPDKIRFSGITMTEYELQEKLVEALSAWTWYTGTHPTDPTGKVTFRCGGPSTVREGLCGSLVRESDEGKAIHLWQTHGYNRDGSIRDESN